ncbi:MFS transporter [Arsenicicoccus dermatophilus]|uniref:MFS transporter n=1 Tax=Arsenicicoccus dermatophilus TaxID=1076331 RepID=UPI001F4C7A88|nr:MFS transporter [Arsenicicoccus dermatophilus]MCH8612819.1 MFS transporter [Arsenicicoccus dermatophilus]
MPSRRAHHPGLAVAALAVGGFAIGTTEFASMGMLPEVARGIDVDIPTAGHLVSAYALGVVVGAPTLAVLGSRLPRKLLLVALMGLFAVAHLASLAVSTYPALMAVRFVAGLPHGAYFGIASLVAASLVDERHRTQAVSNVLMGLTVANVVGVPVATWLGQHVGWQTAYAVVGALGLLTMAAVSRLVPHQEVDPDTSVRRELGALRRPQVWLALLIGTVGFGGMFSTYAYISPTLQTVGHWSAGAVPWILSLYGIGSTAGAAVAGRVARVGILRGIAILLVLIALLLAVWALLLPYVVVGLAATFLLGALPSMLVPLLQTRLMDVAHEGQSLAAALNHSTLNVANALGAWLGSVVLAAGWSYAWPSRVGVVLAVLGLGVTAWSALLGRTTTGPGPTR